jgi:hypothetical protein
MSGGKPQRESAVPYEVEIFLKTRPKYEEEWFKHIFAAGLGIQKVAQQK